MQRVRIKFRPINSSYLLLLKSFFISSLGKPRIHQKKNLETRPAKAEMRESRTAFIRLELVNSSRISANLSIRTAWLSLRRSPNCWTVEFRLGQEPAGLNGFYCEKCLLLPDSGRLISASLMRPSARNSPAQSITNRELR